jgi:hypothetical protein
LQSNKPLSTKNKRLATQAFSTHGRLDRKTVLRLLQRGQQRKLWQWILLEPTAMRMQPMGVIFWPELDITPG